MDKLLLKNVLARFPGKMVTINDHKIHIYTEGKGIPSLVFLSGSGTPSPMYDFKTLFSKMSNEYQIAVVEKAGYGFSEISNVSRDIDTLLSETRTALNEANIAPPYILFPHSMSGIEALYWVKCYPDEIKVIIGLDPALPPIKYGLLNKSDKTICRALIYHRIITNDMINEGLMINENAKKINLESLRKVPMLFFISNGKETGMKKSEWEKLIRDYTKELNVEIVPVNAGHYLHDILPEEISNKSKIFIKQLE
jgi:hypothetical protein